MDADPFVAPFVLQYTYKRSLGPVLQRFFTALREGQLLGARTAGGRVLMPPQEYDPDSGDDIVDLVEVGPSGVVESWTEGPAGAWALIRLDGADTALLHRARGPLSTGCRVAPCWAETRVGQLDDIVAFEVLP